MPHDETKYPASKLVGYNVRRIREYRGMTMHELSVYSRVNYAVLARLERQRGGIYLWKIGKIAEALEVELTELFELPKNGEKLDERVKEYIQHSREL